MLKFQATPEQRKELEGLAYWKAVHSHTLEREGVQSKDLEAVDKNIKYCFTRLDTLGVPFWVQNAVLCWADDWRTYTGHYMSNDLKKRNIFL